MSLADVEAPVRARPPTSEIQTEVPELGPVQPAGKATEGVAEAAGVADEAADAAAEDAEPAADETDPVVAVKSELRLEMADETAKRVRALDPPQIEFLSPEHGMVHAVLVLMREAPLTRVLPQ